MKNSQKVIGSILRGGMLLTSTDGTQPSIFDCYNPGKETFYAKLIRNNLIAFQRQQKGQEGDNLGMPVAESIFSLNGTN